MYFYWGIRPQANTFTLLNEIVNVLCSALDIQSVLGSPLSKTEIRDPRTHLIENSFCYTGRAQDNFHSALKLPFNQRHVPG